VFGYLLVYHVSVLSGGGDRGNHSPTLKAKVAPASLEGDEILTQLAERFDVHPNRITQSRSLVEGVAEADRAERKAAIDGAYRWPILRQALL
jgi:transposase-like protein